MQNKGLRQITREKEIYLSDDYTNREWVNLPDGEYEISHTTWKYVDRTPIELDRLGGSIRDLTDVYTKVYDDKVRVENNYVQLRDIFTIIDPMRTSTSYDPHVFFEGVSVKDNRLDISFGS